MLRTLSIIHLHILVIVFIVVILILIAFQAIAFMEGREGLDLCFEAGGCKAFQLTLVEFAELAGPS
jgi:hypothetical protein